jgi:hypothetical protein
MNASNISATPAIASQAETALANPYTRYQIRVSVSTEPIWPASSARPCFVRRQIGYFAADAFYFLPEPLRFGPAVSLPIFIDAFGFSFDINCLLGTLADILFSQSQTEHQLVSHESPTFYQA